MEDLPRAQSAFQLLEQQLPLPLGSLHEAPVLLGPPGKVGHHLVHGPVGDVLVDREARLPCDARESREERSKKERGEKVLERRSSIKRKELLDRASTLVGAPGGCGIKGGFKR